MSFIKVRSYLYMSLRMVHSKRVGRLHKKRSSNPGVQEKMKFLKNTDSMSLDQIEEILDDEDYSQFESDFMQAHETQKASEREMMKQKEMLKINITKRKVFNEVEPSFLTFAEKIEIQKLNDSDPVTYTPEVLSESFPALPSTIVKVLKSKWKPETVKRVQNYDLKVMENWRKYRNKEMPVSIEMENHLKKFKNRVVLPADEEYIKKYMIKPKIVFAKPRSTLYSNILDNYMKQVETDKASSEAKKQLQSDKLLLSANSVDNSKSVKTYEETKEKVNKTESLHDKNLMKQSTIPKKNNVDTTQINNQKINIHLTNQNIDSTKDGLENLLEYVKDKESVIKQNKPKKIEIKINTTSTIEEHEKERPKIELKNIIHEKICEEDENAEIVKNQEVVSKRNRKSMRKKNQVQTFSEFINTSVEERKYEMTPEAIYLRDMYKRIQEQKNEETTSNDLTNSVLIAGKNEVTEIEESDYYNIKEPAKVERNEGMLNTYVKKWTKKDENENEYPLVIRIPRNRYKEGLTYRVKDCYYDDDGEFLYRVPGIKIYDC